MEELIPSKIMFQEKHEGMRFSQSEQEELMIGPYEECNMPVNGPEAKNSKKRKYWLLLFLNLFRREEFGMNLHLPNY